MEKEDIVDLLVERFDLTRERAETVANTVINALGPAFAVLPIASILSVITGLLGGPHGGGSSDED